MTHRFLALAALLFCQIAAPALMPAAAAAGTLAAQAPPGNPAEQALFAAANAARTQHGLPPLEWDDSLYRAATSHATQMAQRGAISHQFPGEPELSERARQAGARFSVVAENVAEAPSAAAVQQEWMHSPLHRANLLDPRSTSIGVAVVEHGGEMYAVDDFERSVVNLTLGQQEAAVEDLLKAAPSAVAILPSTTNARRTCAMQTGYAGERKPWFVMRYIAADLNALPPALKERLASGKYHHAQVGACTAQATQNFSAYSIAVLLYP